MPSIRTETGPAIPPLVETSKKNLPLGPAARAIEKEAPESLPSDSSFSGISDVISHTRTLSQATAQSPKLLMGPARGVTASAAANRKSNPIIPSS